MDLTLEEALRKIKDLEEECGETHARIWSLQERLKEECDTTGQLSKELKELRAQYLADFGRIDYTWRPK